MVWWFHEPGTTRHCGNCGRWHHALTLNDRTYVCPSCKVELVRDVNGARNNLLAPATALLAHAPWYDDQPAATAADETDDAQEDGGSVDVTPNLLH